MKSYHGHDPSTLVEARVAKVFENYVVAYPTACVGDLRTDDSITFARDVWQGTEEPQVSQVVMLVNPMLYARGWRAREVYPITPCNTRATQQPARSKA